MVRIRLYGGIKFKIEMKTIKSFKIPLLFFIGVILFSLSVNGASAVTTDNSKIYVNTAGSDSSNGQSAVYDGTNGPKATIKNATGTVANQGTIYIAKGTYYENSIQISSNMIIIGENQANTIIDAQGKENIFNMTYRKGVHLTLINLTLKNGYAPGDGGAINNPNPDSVLNIINCSFQNNTSSDDGGAIFNYGTLTSTNNTFLNNNAKDTDGGAIFCKHTAISTNDTFNGNTAKSHGGAFFLNGGNLTCTNDTFNGNSARDSGGAIFNDGTLTCISDTFTNNSSPIGNAIVNWNTCIVHFSRIIGNGAQIDNQEGTVDATINWWGSNKNPSSLVRGSVNVNFWLVLTLTAYPNIIVNGGKSTVDVLLFRDNTGCYHDPIDGHVPDGTPVNFYATDGSLSTQVATLINGRTTSAFTTTDIGKFFVSAIIDNQIGTALLSVKNAPNLVVMNLSCVTGNSVKLISTLYGAKGYPISGAIVSFSVDGVFQGNATTNSNGIVTIEYIARNNGVHTITADYNGNDDYLSSMGSGTLTIRTKPTVTADNTTGIYNTTQIITLKSNNETNTIYYTTDGTKPTENSAKYTNPLTITKTTILTYTAENSDGDWADTQTQIYTIDTVTPKVTATKTTGIYNTTQTVKLTSDKTNTTIYYTTNGTDPTKKSTIYSGPLKISANTTLKYMAVDVAGNKSPVYTQKYTIDKIPPKVTISTPANRKTNVSRTSLITIKFSKNIKANTKINKITIKNQTTGKYITIHKSIKGNTLTIKTSARSANTWYTVTIPAGSVRDKAGNNLKTNHTFKFKTGK